MRDLFGLDSDPESAKTNKAINAAIEKMKSLGATFVDVTIPNLTQILNYPSLSGFEFKDNLNTYLSEHPNAPYKTLQEIIDSGLYLPSNKNTLISRNNVGPLDINTTYQDIIKNRPPLTQNSILTALTGLDALIYPTSITPPQLNTDNQRTGSSSRLSSFSGFPAVALPAGFTSDGLPVGMEFLGRAFTEPLLLQYAYAYEQNTLVRQPPSYTPALAGESIAVPEPTILPAVGVIIFGSITLRLTRKGK